MRLRNVTGHKTYLEKSLFHGLQIIKKNWTIILTSAEFGHEYFDGYANIDKRRQQLRFDQGSLCNSDIDGPLVFSITYSLQNMSHFYCQLLKNFTFQEICL